MFRSMKKVFIALLRNIVIWSNHTKCMLLSNQKRMNQATLINLYPSEYNQEFHYYSFAVKLDRCVGSWNTLNELSNEVCVPNKTDLNLSVFSMITWITKSKTLTKHISCECEGKFDRPKLNLNQWWNNDKCQCECG